MILFLSIVYTTVLRVFLKSLKSYFFFQLTAQKYAQKCPCKHWSSQCFRKKWYHLFCYVKLHTKRQFLRNAMAFRAFFVSLNFVTIWSIVDLFGDVGVVDVDSGFEMFAKNWTNTFVIIILRTRLYNKYMLRNTERTFVYM